jgi:ankyrin repeat protein
MRDLIRAGVDVNIQSKSGQTALIVAVGANEEEMVEALLKAGADPDVKDLMGTSARQYASLFHNKTIQANFETYAPKKAV